jgi:hypothetical protein
MANTHPICKLCCKGIRGHENFTKCTSCFFLLHNRCLPNYSATDIEYASNVDNSWTCPPCLQQIFPFSNIDANSSIIEAINNPINLTIDLEQLESMVFDPFNTNDDNSEGPLSDIDPDQNFLNDIRGTAIQNCKYFYSSDLIENLNDNAKNAELSIFHLNIRSTPKNLNTLIPTLHSSGLHFDILGFSETWLKPSNVDCYGIPGYSHESITRPDKSGGGVSLYINEKWSYKMRHDLNTISDDLEMLWIEVDKDSVKSTSNLLLGLIYRRPGYNPA